MLWDSRLNKVLWLLMTQGERRQVIQAIKNHIENENKIQLKPLWDTVFKQHDISYSQMGTFLKEGLLNYRKYFA